MNPRLLRTPATALMVALTLAALAAARPARADGEQVSVSVTPPRDGRAGKLVLIVPKAEVLAAVRKAIPDSAGIPEQKLGDKAIYRDVRLSNLKAVGLTPTSLSFDNGVFHVAGNPAVKGELNAIYLHVVVNMVEKEVEILGQKAKVKVPQQTSGWRPRPPTPFEVKAEVRGTCKVSFPGGGVLAEQRLHLETQAEYVRITEVKVTTDDVFLKIVEGVLGAVGGAFPNEGLNKPIKDALTRSVDLDPFQSLSKQDRDGLKKYKVRNVAVDTTDAQVKITADLDAL